MITLEKIIYFLMACNREQVVLFLSKYSYSLKDNEKLPASFLKKSYLFFKKNRKLIILENNPLLAWQYFCKYSSYEEVLPVLLYGILKYSKEQILWLLNISPDILSYRLNRGLLFLGEKLCEIQFEEKNNTIFNSQKELSKAFRNQVQGQKQQKALMYCHWLANYNFSYERKIKKKAIKYLLPLLLCFICFSFFIGLILLIVSPSSTVILYQSYFK